MEKIYTPCSPCGGTGKETVSSIVDGESVNEEITCRSCGGDGTISNSTLSSDLIDFLNDMNNKIDDILEKLNE